MEPLAIASVAPTSATSTQIYRGCNALPWYTPRQLATVLSITSCNYYGFNVNASSSLVSNLPYPLASLVVQQPATASIRSYGSNSVTLSLGSNSARVGSLLPGTALAVTATWTTFNITAVHRPSLSLLFTAASANNSNITLNGFARIPIADSSLRIATNLTMVPGTNAQFQPSIGVYQGTTIVLYSNEGSSFNITDTYTNSTTNQGLPWIPQYPTFAGTRAGWHSNG